MTAAATGQNLANRCEPDRDCSLCGRLSAFRNRHRLAEPDWHNAPVPSFGPPDARLLIVGLAPGLRGANRTGRPFTGDYAGDLLYATLLEMGLARGTYAAQADDGLNLIDCRITNAVRCVPPQNKPEPGEIAACRQFLSATLENNDKLSVILALGRIAHDSTLSALGCRRSAYAFSHGARHCVPFAGGTVTLHDSYHCSRYNTNTGRLTPQMFRSVFVRIKEDLGRSD